MIARSKERSFVLLLLSMAAVGFLMMLDNGLSGGGAKPLAFVTLLAAQAALMVWLVRSENERVTYFAEAGAAAPILWFYGLAKLGLLS